MKKILLALSLVFSVMAAANADAYCCRGGGYRGGYGGSYGAGWVIGGVVAGAVIGSALAAPYYYPPGYYGPAPYYAAPQVVVQQPVVQVQQPLIVQSQSNNGSVSTTTLKPAPAGYHWQIMTNPQTNASQVVLVPN
ncbi:MAG: hypothetical protein WCG12_02340 [Alcaligenaceae bacterium]